MDAGLEVLLGMPLEMPRPGVLDSCETFTVSHRDVVLESLAHAISWVRTLLSVFSSSSSSSSSQGLGDTDGGGERTGKLVMRMNLLVELEAMLVSQCQR